MEVDGPNNTVVECDTIAPPTGPENPYGNAFFVEERVAQDGARGAARRRFRQDALLEGHQPRGTNWVGKPTGYKLEAKSPVRPFTHPDSPSGRRGRFIQHQLWVTPFEPGRALSGRRVRQPVDRQRRPRDLDRQGPADREHRHRALAQLRPASPAAAGGPSGAALRGCGFTLMPVGFFDQNPVIDLPPANQQGELLRVQAITSLTRGSHQAWTAR